MDFSSARYYGDSYLEFQGLYLNMQNFIHLEFKTYKPDGLLLYIEESPKRIGQFLIQLFIRHGVLQYQFLCGKAAEVKNITTTARVDDGHWYKVQIRQSMVPCEAEMLILEISAKTRSPSNFSSSSYGLETGSMFVGGLPYYSAIKQNRSQGTLRTMQPQAICGEGLDSAILNQNMENRKIELCLSVHGEIKLLKPLYLKLKEYGKKSRRNLESPAEPE
ncbi:protein eyes shut homolog [Numida meleagris]|uniref:protein eyes shut homolog n=1 Tax=Numida meleagris TaxID=8996 RepID=UPI000B3DE28C|nr:protein eyes shut homolog [Numida meleagris]